ncbi:multiple sugar transport system substrate-binding protein [Kribbella sp. VKM Ac-2527]|uniref:Multiple sugar transport system substrate-binding protein n=1 Tax=Kribbella caucasensis TaxID=2512215 RepID=A0A4R6JM27_9ACTN|nr:sugar ABC transporter substrate-binding protein [Kribbella sp. VKM Ac-2527]TDO36381.1 multiple sugar transport system substrate-binding protein [Kribbella sp. VKM Ac-2527]
MKTSVSRILAPLTAFAVAATLAACGDSSESSSTGSVTVWMYPVIADEQANTAYWAQVEKDFEAANSGTDLKVEQQPWANRDQKLAAAFSGGKGPDVLLLGPDQIPQYVKNGSLAPVDKVVEPVKSSFLPGALTALTTDGKLYAAPIYHTITTTLYNKKLLDKAGITTPPQTWDEIKAAAPKLKAAGVATLDYSASPEATLNLNFYPLLWQAGGSVFSADGKKAAFNEPAGVEALTFLTSLYSEGAIPKSGLTNGNVIADQALGKQQVAMGFTNTPADAKTVTTTWGAGNVVVGMPLEGKKRVGFGLPGGLAVNAASKNIEAAEKFLTFMIEPKQVVALGTASGFLSPRTDAKVPAKDAQAEKFADALQYAFPGEPNPAARQVMSLLAAEIQAALTGKKTPQQALDDGAKAADDLLSRQR